MTTKQKKIAREIFETVYGWGRNNVVVTPTNFVYQNEINKLLGNKNNGVHKIGATYIECWTPNCKKKHLPF